MTFSTHGWADNSIAIDGSTYAINTGYQITKLASGVKAFMSVRAVFTGASGSARVSIARVPNGGTYGANACYLERRALIAPGVPLEITVLPLGGQDEIYIESDSPDVQFSAYGVVG